MEYPNCNADVQANTLFSSLTLDAPVPERIDFSDEKFNFESDLDSELYKEINPVSLEQLTEVDLCGEGVFDKLMASIDLHINREFKGSRITGDQYAKVYTEVSIAVLNQSVTFLLQRDQAKWAAITAQMQARVAEIQATEALINLEMVKIEAQKVFFDMQNSGAQYALTKMQIANADAAYCLTQAQTAGEKYKVEFLMPTEQGIQQYQLNNMLPIEYAAKDITANRLLPTEASLKEFDLSFIKPLEKDLNQINVDTGKVNLNQMLPIQVSKEQYVLDVQLPAQTSLVNEQIEVQRSQTSDTRSDGSAVAGVVGTQRVLLEEQVESERSKTLDTRTNGVTIVGSVGKQKDLYTQQIDSFRKDSKQKAAKMWLDGWTVQKTLDENLASPNQLDVPSVSAVLTSLRIENGL